MWSKSYSKWVKGIDVGEILKVWTDINQWQTWQEDIEYAKIDGEFQKGSMFLFKPKGGPEIKIDLTEVKENSVFVDLTRFPLAKMYDAHKIIDHGDELEINSTISIEGPLSFLWRKIIVEDIASGMEAQTEKLIERVRNE